MSKYSNLKFFTVYNHTSFIERNPDSIYKKIPACRLDKKLIKEYFDYYDQKHLPRNHDHNIDSRFIHLFFLLNFVVEKYYSLPTIPYCHKCYGQDDSKYIRGLLKKYFIMSEKFADVLLKDEVINEDRFFTDIICKNVKQCFHPFFDKDRLIDMTGRLALLEL